MMLVDSLFLNSLAVARRTLCIRAQLKERRRGNCYMSERVSSGNSSLLCVTSDL